MPTTTNFGWTTPADTDLVKDGAAAIRTLGNGIDTSLLDLKGGTTGQVLSKNSNTDLDYTWVTPNVGDITEVQAGTGISVASGTGPIPVVTNDMATTITAAGDIVVGTGSGTYDNLPIGTTGQVLTADTTVSPYKVKWASAGTSFVGCRLTKSASQTISNSTDTALTWDTETYDTDGFHSTVSNTDRITIPSGKTGYYLVEFRCTWVDADVGVRRHRIKKNAGGTVVMNFHQAAADDNNNQSAQMSDVIYLSATDYIYAEVRQNSGGNMDVLSDAFEPACTVFNVTYLGA